MGKPVLFAACAPRTFNIGPRTANRTTVRVLRGAEDNPARLADHVDRFIDHHLLLLERAAAAGAQVAVIPEDATRLAVIIQKQHRLARCVDAIAANERRCAERFGQFAREHDLYVVGGWMTTRRRRFYNSALLLGPGGGLLAGYDKTHLPKGEERCTPGAKLPVFDTPLGKVGMLICWDIVYPEPYAALALQGAQVIIQPTFGHWHKSDDITAQSRAQDWAVPLVVSMWGGCACIVSGEGKFLAHTGRRSGTVALAELDLTARRAWLFYQDVRKQKPAGRRPELYPGAP